MLELASTIIPLVRSHRLRFGTEQQLHEDVAALLTSADVLFVAEMRLSDADRIDFYLPDHRIGIECKVDGGPTAVASQLLRYARHDGINELILITSRRSHLLSVDQLCGKLCHCIWIGGSSL
ncbi:hypothetical protein NA78x_001770 [Anatilimnocola sp. NA78]|uniref:hypothetical protein n=1 Tax=Anatilimnocola sp. NA78 TaxID=3415683 RepID=UPI003CE5316B